MARRAVATAVARRRGARIRSVCTTKGRARAGSSALGFVPTPAALVTRSAAPATFFAPRGERADSRDGRSSHPTAFPRVCVGGYGPFAWRNSDEEIAGQSRVGDRPRGGSRARSRRPGPADRRHHRNDYVERRPVDAGRDGHGRLAGAAGRAVRRHRRQRHLRRPRPAAGRIHRHHRDGRHGHAPSGRPASSSGAPCTVDVGHGPGRRRRAGDRRAPKPCPSSPTRPSAPTSTPS